MSHAISSTINPVHVASKIVSRDKFAIFNLNRQLTVSRSMPSKLNGGLIDHFERRRSSLVVVHSSVNGKPSTEVENTFTIKDFVEIELQVRDYEVDQYGVVNNAVYSSYCQHAHHELLTSFGETPEEINRYRLVAVSNLSFKFLAPLRSMDMFVIKARVSHFSLARVFIELFIYKLPNYELILEAKSTLVWIDENHRPVRIPLELKYRLTQLGLKK